MQSLPPLEPISYSQSFVCGEVTVHEGAAIAVGVLLQADPGSQNVIASGVCIGMGSIIHAQRGTLTIGAAANLGSGVLVVGCGTIGAGACIGSMTTLQDPNIAPGEIIAPSSLICNAIPDEPSASAETSEPAEPVNGESTKPAAADEPSPDSPSASSTVYGLDAFNQLKQSLFRH